MLRTAREFLEIGAGAADPRPGQIRDRVIDRLQSGRTLAGLAATGWMLVSYPLAEGRAEFAFGKLVDLVAGFGILCVAGLVAVTVFITAARPPLRRVYFGRLKAPGETLRALLLGTLMAGGGGTLLAKLLQGEVIPWSEIRSHGILATAVVFLPFVVLVLPMCLVVVAMGAFSVLSCVWYSFNSCFRLGDVHELLPALVSPVLVWSLFVLSCLDGPDVNAPPLVLYPFLLGGPLSVTALSVWEIRRLNRRYGLTFASALGRGPGPEGEPEPTGYGVPSPYAAPSSPYPPYPPCPTPPYPPHSS
ncbi:hypothetical protein [Streptomyces sp. NBC_01235]|uniref:hypothetical protein n=1 Tax=Streptomyces sp. NBC_01235 TaxID=2903788 RepID=UPI002E115266|nr:hypothetical protein OG289_19780 [Streptomyces sp. NBC_01235]